MNSRSRQIEPEENPATPLTGSLAAHTFNNMRLPAEHSFAFLELPPFSVLDHTGRRDLFHDSDIGDAESTLLDMLHDATQGTLLFVDFTGVRIASAAARQLLKRAMLRLRSGEIADRYLVLGDLGDSYYNVHTMLVSESLTVVERTLDEGPKLRGIVDPAVQTTYDFLVQARTATASAVQEKLQLNNISTATNRLTSLGKLALARRIERRTVTGGGREYVYAAVQ